MLKNKVIPEFAALLGSREVLLVSVEQLTALMHERGINSMPIFVVFIVIIASLTNL